MSAGAVGYISKGADSRALVGQKIAECRAILGGEYSPMRAVWDEQATQKDRSLLLKMAGHAGSMATRLSSRAWCDLLPETRAAVEGGLRRWREWSDRLK